RLEHGEPLARREMIEPVAQRSDRLRRVVAAPALGLELPGRLNRCAGVGHSRLDADFLQRDVSPWGCKGNSGPAPGRGAPTRAPPLMLDLGTSFVASVARDGDALAIVDGDLRLSYRDWYQRISALVAGFDKLGLKAGDHIVTLLQNRWEAATIHWACQF